MRTSLLILVATVLFACNSNTEVKPDNNTVPAKDSTAAPDCSVAVKFVTDYIEFTSAKTAPKSDKNWIGHNPLLTDNFKTAHKNLLDSALKKDPELGLDFDPILDAQDFPEKGFELINCDKATGYVTLSGKDWKDFDLVLKLVLQDNKWLVDGAGVINIPVDKRAKR